MCVWPWPGWGAGSILSGPLWAGRAVFFFSGRPNNSPASRAGQARPTDSAPALISEHGWLAARLMVCGLSTLSPWEVDWMRDDLAWSRSLVTHQSSCMHHALCPLPCGLEPGRFDPIYQTPIFIGSKKTLKH